MRKNQNQDSQDSQELQKWRTQLDKIRKNKIHKIKKQTEQFKQASQKLQKRFKNHQATMKYMIREASQSFNKTNSLIISLSKLTLETQRIQKEGLSIMDNYSLFSNKGQTSQKTYQNDFNQYRIRSEQSNSNQQQMQVQPKHAYNSKQPNMQVEPRKQTISLQQTYQQSSLVVGSVNPSV